MRLDEHDHRRVADPRPARPERVVGAHAGHRRARYREEEPRNQIAFYTHGTVAMAPSVQQPIYGGQVIIGAGLEKADAQQLPRRPHRLSRSPSRLRADRLARAVSDILRPPPPSCRGRRDHRPRPASAQAAPASRTRSARSPDPVRTMPPIPPSGVNHAVVPLRPVPPSSVAGPMRLSVVPSHSARTPSVPDVSSIEAVGRPRDRLPAVLRQDGRRLRCQRARIEDLPSVVRRDRHPRAIGRQRRVHDAHGAGEHGSSEQRCRRRRPTPAVVARRRATGSAPVAASGRRRRPRLQQHAPVVAEAQRREPDPLRGDERVGIEDDLSGPPSRWPRPRPRAVGRPRDDDPTTVVARYPPRGAVGVMPALIVGLAAGRAPGDERERDDGTGVRVDHVVGPGPGVLPS